METDKGVRVIILTANLTFTELHYPTQGVW